MSTRRTNGAPQYGPPGLTFPAPVIPVNVYGAWLVRDWQHCARGEWVDATHFTVEGGTVYLVEQRPGREPLKDSVGELPPGWAGACVRLPDLGYLQVVGPAAAVAAAQAASEAYAAAEAEVLHAVYGVAPPLTGRLDAGKAVAP